MIRPATMDDGPAIAGIYNWYIENSTITFEEEPVDAGDIAQRVAVADATMPWLVLEEEAGEGARVLGYASAVRWNPRSAYRFTRETSIYLRRDCLGRGHGGRLYRHLIDAMRGSPVHVLVAGIALPNPDSVALHEKLGFRKVGQIGEVGYKFERYIDVGYWQLDL